MSLIICPICYGRGKIVGTMDDPHATHWSTPMVAKVCPKCHGDSMIDEDEGLWPRA